MGVVYEAAVQGLPAIAFSARPFAPDSDFSSCEPWMEQIIAKVLTSGLPAGVCLNVNMPDNPLGLKVVPTAMGKWEKEYEHRVDPFGVDYYWVSGEYRLNEPDNPNSDVNVVNSGWVAVTPCRVDPTAHSLLDEISTLLT